MHHCIPTAVSPQNTTFAGTFSLITIYHSCTMTTLIKGGSLLLPAGIAAADMLIEDGTICRIKKNIKGKATHIIDAAGLTIMPAFVDMHCHLRDPGQHHKEDIASGTLSALRGGYAAVCCMPNTTPPIDNAPLVHYVKSKSKETARVRVYPIGAITKGLQGKELAEMGLMLEAGAVAFSDDGVPVESGGMMALAMDYARTFGTLIISHCEDKSIASDGVVNEGTNSVIAGLRGISRAAEDVMVARDIILAEAKGARLHIAHVSTRGSVELVRQAKRRGVKVTCETCPHYFAATDAEILNYNTNAKINPPLRTPDDVNAVITGLADGTIDAIATDHAPHHVDEKQQEFDNAPNGTVGFETAFGVAYTHLVLPKHITLNRLSELMSRNPATIMNIGKGIIAEGTAADIVFVDLNARYVVDASKFASKGKNSVFNGCTLQGVVVDTKLSANL
jgi:dihydroorotase